MKMSMLVWVTEVSTLRGFNVKKSEPNVYEQKLIWNSEITLTAVGLFHILLPSFCIFLRKNIQLDTAGNRVLEILVVCTWEVCTIL